MQYYFAYKSALTCFLSLINLYDFCLEKAKLAGLQRLQSWAIKIIKNTKIKDVLSCPGMSVANIICFNRNVMTYKILHKGPVFHLTVGEIAKISISLSIGLSTLKKAFTTQLLKMGIICLLIYVSCQQ